MPTIHIEGYRFRFYSSDRHEPPHMHVIRGENEAKVWLKPVRVEYSYGYSRPELSRVIGLAWENQDRLLEAWNDHFAS
jgi:Domain of unknown function (DUF4160)